MPPVGFPGYLSSDYSPLVASGVSELRALARAIGVSTQEYRYNPSDNRTIENFALHQLIGDDFQVMGQNIVSVLESANAGIFAIMPLLRAEGINFRHYYYEVVPELAVETSAQAPPNYLEVAKSSTEATLTRHALGVTATVQELRTAEGQFFFMGKLAYLAVAFTEQAELHAFRAITDTPSSWALYAASRNVWDIDLARVGRVKDEYWDILRRVENGFFVLRDLIVQDFADKRLNLTHVMMRSGTRSTLAADEYRTKYYQSGPGARQRAEELGDSFGDVIGGLEVIVVRAYEYERKDLRVDPLDRHTVIGAHYRMAPNFHPQCDMDKWCSANMEIEIYSVESDEWERITLKTAIRAMGRFDNEGRLHQWHEELINRWETYLSEQNRSVPVFDRQYDMFLYLTASPSGLEATVNKVAVFGHMEEWALTHETHVRTARGIANFVRSQLDKSELDAIRRGLADIAELYNTPLSNRDLLFARISTTTGLFGAPRLPTLAEIGAAGTGLNVADFVSYRPRGAGTVSGYFELARAANEATLSYVDQEMAKRAVAFKDAAAKLHQAFSVLFDQSTHVALNPLFVSENLRANSTSKNAATINSTLNFLQNIVDQNKAVLYFGPTTLGPNDPARVGVAPSSSVPVAFTALPQTAPAAYTDAQGIATKIASPTIGRVFADEASIAQFEARFAASKFGVAYAAYLARRRPAVDGDGGAAVPADGASLLEQFITNEVESRETLVEQAAVLKRTIDYVAGNTAPRVINEKALRELGADRGVELRQAVETDPIAGGRVTGLAVSVDALRLSSPDVQANVALVSPLLPGRVLRLSELTGENLAALDATGNNNNIERLVAFSSARPARVVPGTRADQGVPSDFRGLGEFDGTTVPTYAYQQFVDQVGAEPVVIKQLADRYRYYGNLPDWLLRVSGQMFLLAPVIEQTLLSFADHDVPLPISFLLEQFNRRYITSSMVWIAHDPANPVGNTFYFDPDMHVGRDAIRKTLMYHMSMYLGAMINDPRRFFISHDTLVVGYAGGENALPFDQESFSPKNLDMLPEINGPSLLVFGEPAHVLIGGNSEEKVPTTHDIRGYSDRIGNARSAAYGHGSSRPHHPSALYYTTRLRLELIKRPTMDDCFQFERAPGVFNTVTHQGTQRIMDPSTRKFTMSLHAHDQFKTAVGPGSRELRSTRTPKHYPAHERLTLISA